MKTMAAMAAVMLAAGCGPRGEDKAEAGAGAGAGKAALAQTPGTAVRTETREFRDWQAVCDNGNQCFAFGFAPDYDAGWVRVSMPAGADAEPGIAFGMWGDDFFKGAEAGAPQPAVGLEIDGRRYPGVVADAADDDAPVGVIQTNTRAVISALAAARTVSVAAGERMAISPAGASAALLWIDERQGRLGTTTALIRRGERAAGTVPGAAALPAIQAAAAADQTGFGDDKQTLPATLGARPEVRQCLEDSAYNEWLKDNVMSARLDARTELWAVPCGAGAYNVTHYWYVTGPGGRNPRPAELFGSGGPLTGEQAEVWPDNSTVNGGYDPATRSISAFSKGRGLGDCGSAQTWVWTGRRFELSKEIMMGNCAGVPVDFWPTTFRSR